MPPGAARDVVDRGARARFALLLARGADVDLLAGEVPGNALAWTAWGSSHLPGSRDRPGDYLAVAALWVAASLGLAVRQAVILEDWNNTIVRLAPSPIVAKVGTSHLPDARLESLERELEVAEHLAARGAPVVWPARDLPPGPHHSRELTLTLWQYVESAPGCGTPISSDRGRHVERARGADRLRLRELEAVGPVNGIAVQPLHGSPHTANWIPSANGPMLLDFETACVGPIEWDLTVLGDDVLACWPDADRDLIATLRRMRSACVAAKCWVSPDRAPEVREVAQVHLKLLHGLALD